PSTRHFKVLYKFTGGADGATPYDANLVHDTAGNLYGTTEEGGNLSCSDGYTVGCGVVFKLKPDGTEKVLHTFNLDGTDGGVPNGGVIQDSAGTLYGTTF